VARPCQEAEVEDAAAAAAAAAEAEEEEVVVAAAAAHETADSDASVAPARFRTNHVLLARLSELFNTGMPTPRIDQARPVQVDRMKPMLKPSATKRLKLKCDIMLSTSAFKFNLRRYNQAQQLATELRALGSITSKQLSAWFDNRKARFAAAPHPAAPERRTEAAAAAAAHPAAPAPERRTVVVLQEHERQGSTDDFLTQISLTKETSYEVECH